MADPYPAIGTNYRPNIETSTTNPQNIIEKSMKHHRQINSKPVLARTGSADSERAANKEYNESKGKLRKI